MRLLFILLVIFTPTLSFAQDVCFVCKPAELRKIKLGNYDLQVYYLQPNVLPPTYGYFLSSEDWKEVKRTINSFDEKIIKIKENERQLCDLEIINQQNLCQEQNAYLDSQVIQKSGKLETQDKLIKSLEQNKMWLKLSLIVTNSLFVGTTIYLIAIK